MCQKATYSIRPDVVRSDEPWQHNLAHNRTRHRPLLGKRPVIIAAVHRDDEVELGHDKQVLTAPADAAHPMVQLLCAAGREIARIPLIAIAAASLDCDNGRGDARDPLDWDDLLAAP